MVEFDLKVGARFHEVVKLKVGAWFLEVVKLKVGQALAHQYDNKEHPIHLICAASLAREHESLLSRPQLNMAQQPIGGDNLNLNNIQGDILLVISRFSFLPY